MRCRCGMRCDEDGAAGVCVCTLSPSDGPLSSPFLSLSSSAEPVSSPYWSPDYSSDDVSGSGAWSGSSSGSSSGSRSGFWLLLLFLALLPLRVVRRLIGWAVAAFVGVVLFVVLLQVLGFAARAAGA